MSRNNYTPRRCSTRWLDGDCPAEVLAIMGHGPGELERYDIIYTNVENIQYEDSRRVERWMMLLCCTASGPSYHNEMQAHEVAAYRYRKAHRYTKWSDLPAAVQKAVRDDLKTWTRV